MATATQNVQNAVSRAVTEAREGDFKAVKKDVTVAAREASNVVNQQLGKVRQVAKNNPGAAAGICFGLGAVIGAAIYAAARPQPSAYQSLMRALRDSASRTRNIFNAGWSSARRAM
jgi:outer membrane receptor for monomeric catechols